MWTIFIMLSIGPIGCLFSRRCWANLDFLFPYLISRKCSRKRTLKGLADCPIYFMLQEGHVSWYMPHFSYLLKMCLCRVTKSFAIVLSVVNVTLKLVFLKIFVINLLSFPKYVNLAHFIPSTSCFISCFVYFIWDWSIVFSVGQYLLYCIVFFQYFVRW
jgi:hypothetical protein